ncbi:6719_t:CDS:2, partial [Entrophospora sp. SA101]
NKVKNVCNGVIKWKSMIWSDGSQFTMFCQTHVLQRDGILEGIYYASELETALKEKG